MNWHSKYVMKGSLVKASTNSITMSWYQPGWLSGHLPQQELEFFLSIPLSTTVGTNLPQSKPVDWQRREILKWESFYPSVRRLYLRSIDFQCFLTSILQMLKPGPVQFDSCKFLLLRFCFKKTDQVSLVAGVERKFAMV